MNALIVNALIVNALIVNALMRSPIAMCTPLLRLGEPDEPRR